MPYTRSSKLFAMIVSGVLIWFCCLPGHARGSLVDSLSRLVGYTILSCSSLAKASKELDSGDIKLRLANGMIFSVDNIDESEAESWSGPEVVVLANKVTIANGSTIIIYKLAIEDEIYDAFRLR